MLNSFDNPESNKTEVKTVKTSMEKDSIVTEEKNDEEIQVDFDIQKYQRLSTHVRAEQNHTKKLRKQWYYFVLPVTIIVTAVMLFNIIMALVAFFRDPAHNE